MADNKDSKQRTRTPKEVKRDRQSKAANARNRAARTKGKNAVKAVRAPLASGDVAAAEGALSSTMSTLQKLAQKGVLPKRTVARRISRLAKAIKAAKA